ncbi:MAG: hypothetical protein LUG46_05080 [Erysipelotrichaceae bacterium]|nr:hypothetical protein [Erysipelotrichaceae bacterium]
MKKLLSTLAAFALVATALVGCKSESATAATYAQVGLGVVSSVEDGEISTTFVAVGLDSEGVIQYIDLDVAQSTPGTDSEYTQTKQERGDDYGMKDYSASLGNIENGGEWYEQAEAFEQYCVGKTADEVAATEVDENGYATGEDLTSSCTIHVTDFVEATTKACENAKDTSADSIVMGRTMSNDDDTLDTTMIVFALDSDSKVVTAILDIAQIDNEGETLQTKLERGDDYGMKDYSASLGNIDGGGEWYEQAAAFEEYCVGKTVDEINATEVDESGYATGEDLTSSCTINLSAILEAASKAQ